MLCLLYQWVESCHRDSGKYPPGSESRTGSYAFLVIAQLSDGVESAGAESPLILHNCFQLISRLVIV